MGRRMQRATIYSSSNPPQLSVPPEQLSPNTSAFSMSAREQDMAMGGRVLQGNREGNVENVDDMEYFSDSSSAEDDGDEEYIEDADAEEETGKGEGSVAQDNMDEIMEGSSASTRSSVKYVAAAIAKFSEEKKDLVKLIGFGGLLEMPQINKVSRAFTVWLLSKLQPESRTIVVDGVEVIDMVDMDVKRILGIPCGGRPVTGISNEDTNLKKLYMTKVLGADPNEKNSLRAAGKIVRKEYPGPMSKKERDNFKVAFVVFVVGHLLAPTTKNGVGNCSFWGAIRNPDEIQYYNWGEYVVEQVVDAAIKVQSDIKTKRKVCNITGCSIFLQILYLDSVKIKGVDKKAHVTPRIKAYDCTTLRLVMEADQASSSSGSKKRSWGTNVVRTVPNITDAKSHEETETNLGSQIPIPPQMPVSYGFELGKFLKESFNGKLNKMQMDALAVYGTRCASHFEELKATLMKENLVLLEFLLSSGRTQENVEKASTPPRQPCVKNKVVTFGKSEKISGQVQGSSSQRSGPVQGSSSKRSCLKRSSDRIQCTPGYQSADEGYVIRRKPRNQPMKSWGSKDHNLPETILSGGPIYPSEADIHIGEVPNISADIDRSKDAIGAPSFDLSFDNQVEDDNVQLGNSGNVQVGNNERSEAEQPTRATDGVPDYLNAQLGCMVTPMPMNNKRKMNENSWRTPDHRFKGSTVSPGSLSKIFADHEVMQRIITGEDELNMNKRSYNDEVTDSPIVKHVVVVQRLARSPWFYELKHNLMEPAKASQLVQKLMKSGTHELEKTWISHVSPRYLEVTGNILVSCFQGKEPFDYSLYDLAVRRLVQLEDEMYKNCNDRRWRHIIDSEFSVLSQAEQTTCCMRSIREQFLGPRIKHEINRCRMIVVPAQVLFDWCVYFWDFKKKCVHVFDPFYKMEENEFYQKKHSRVVEKIRLDIDTVSANFFDKWDIDWKDWHNDFVNPPLPVVPCNESGPMTLLGIREFDGKTFRNYTQESYEEFKVVLLAEMLAMQGNQAKVLVMSEAVKPVAKIIYDVE